MCLWNVWKLRWLLYTPAVSPCFSPFPQLHILSRYMGPLVETSMVYSYFLSMHEIVCLDVFLSCRANRLPSQTSILRVCFLPPVIIGPIQGHWPLPLCSNVSSGLFWRSQWPSARNRSVLWLQKKLYLSRKHSRLFAANCLHMLEFHGTVLSHSAIIFLSYFWGV